MQNNNIILTNNREIMPEFLQYIGRNVYNVKSDFEQIYPDYEICIFSPTSVITTDYRENRIRIGYDNNFEVRDITLG